MIVNSVCPGMVKTDIGRTVADQAWYMKALVWVYMTVTGKPPEYGARHYVKAAVRPKEEHVSRGNCICRGFFKLIWPSGTVLDRMADL